MKIDIYETNNVNIEKINDADICEVCGNGIGLDLVSRIVRGREERFCCSNCASIFKSASRIEFLKSNI